ncbi:hypothetical protein ACFQDD_07085, partial [Halorubrum pallidum]
MELDSDDGRDGSSGGTQSEPDRNRAGRDHDGADGNRDGSDGDRNGADREGEGPNREGGRRRVLFVDDEPGAADLAATHVDRLVAGVETVT